MGVFLTAIVLLVLLDMLGIKSAPSRSKEGYSNRSSGIRAQRTINRMRRGKFF